ncbi:MAG: hypothetical protein U0234_33490 [Sandaracinus sp.]
MRARLAWGLALLAGVALASPAAALTADPVARILHAAEPEMQRCASHLAPHDRVRVTLALVIAPDGRVTDTGIDEGARGVRGCVRRVAMALVFPTDSSGAERRVSLPLMFSSP